MFKELVQQYNEYKRQRKEQKELRRSLSRQIAVCLDAKYNGLQVLELFNRIQGVFKNKEINSELDSELDSLISRLTLYLRRIDQMIDALAHNNTVYIQVYENILREESKWLTEHIFSFRDNLYANATEENINVEQALGEVL